MGLGAVYACTDMNDPQQEYLDLGEEIYVGKPLGIITNAGDERIKFNIVISADPKISKGIISWNNYTESHEFTVSRESESWEFITVEMDIPEGSYAFDVRLQDDGGNESLGFDHSAVVYGENYSSTLVNRGVSGIEALPGQAKVMWSNAEPSVTSTTFSYENNMGELKEIVVQPTDSEIIIEDYVLGGSFSYYSWHKPDMYALDSFQTATDTDVFPETVLLDRSTWLKVGMLTDSPMDCYGGSIENLWDGNKGSWYHSGCSPETGIPHHFTIDLGISAGLSKFRVTPRQECCQGRNPKKFQIWGIQDIENAETTAAPDDPNWADDAIAKGWVLLSDVETDPSWNGSAADYDVDIPENISVKYIRFRFLEAFVDEGGQTALAEFTFWARSVN